MYRWIQRYGVYPLLLKTSCLKKEVVIASQNQSAYSLRFWFHAASSGELNSLIPLIDKAQDHAVELILTVFSPSALPSLKKLLERLKQRGPLKLLFAGTSPWEGGWKSALQELKPSLWITSHYEAWPELWAALGEAQVKLAMVSAQCRPSLRWASWMNQVLGMTQLPSMILFAVSETEVLRLKRLFPQAQCFALGETRWDHRAQQRFLGRAEWDTWIAPYLNCPRPWGILGNAWHQDLIFLKPVLDSYQGTLWVVPHNLSSRELRLIQGYLQKQSWDRLIWTQPHAQSLLLVGEGPGKRECILVNELNRLAHLYALMDWCFMGGGFGSGVHHPIEPAFEGLPIGMGPRGIHRFSVIQELIQTGQIQVLKTKRQLNHWAHLLQTGQLSANRGLWKQQAENRLGASQRIWEVLQKQER